MASRIVTVLVSTLVLASLIGCGKTITLYVIQDHDIMALEAEEEFKAPVDGYFLSDFWMDKVGEAKVE